MKMVVGVGCCFRTLNARVVNIVRDRQRRQKKGVEPLTSQKKPRGATSSHCKAFVSHFSKQKKRATVVIWSLARGSTVPRCTTVDDVRYTQHASYQDKLLSDSPTSVQGSRYICLVRSRIDASMRTC